MKHAFLTASLLLASLSVLPNASAEAADLPIQCHGPLDGYQFCEVQQGACHAGEEYWRGDVHAHAECRPTDGKSQCGVDAYVPELLVTYHCFRDEGRVSPWDYVSGPASAPASASVPVDCHGPLDGYQTCEVVVGRCHAGEEYRFGDVHAHAECQPNDGKSRCGVDVYASPVVVTRHCGSTYEQVWPMETTAVGACQEYPGYERCDYTAGPCTVTTYYFYHDAFYVVDGPHCDKPTTTASHGEPLQCWGTDGLLACEVEADPCHAGFRYERGEVEDVHAQCF